MQLRDFRHGRIMQLRAKEHVSGTA